MLCHRFQYFKAQTNKNPIDFILCYHYYSGCCFQHTESFRCPWGLLSTLLNHHRMEHFVTAPHPTWRSHWHNRVLVTFLHKWEEAVPLGGEVTPSCVLSLESHGAVSAFQPWTLAQGWMGRSEPWDQHTLVQLCNISFEHIQRFISLSCSSNLWSSKFKFPMVPLAIFSAVFWLQAIWSLPSLHFLYGLLYAKVLMDDSLTK